MLENKPMRLPDQPVADRLVQKEGAGKLTLPQYNSSSNVFQLFTGKTQLNIKMSFDISQVTT